MTNFTSGALDQEGIAVPAHPASTHAANAPPVNLLDPQFDMRGLSWNPLCDAAIPLIGLVIRLHSIDKHDDVVFLYQSIHNQIATVMEEVTQLDYEPGALKAYSYSLCLLLDETVMSTPWGGYCEWSQRSLLSAFHQETFGGEKFFTVLARMSTEAPRYQHVLEFMYLCLCMGVKGKYGKQVNGDLEVQKIISNVHALLRPLRGETPKHLTEPLTHVAPRNYRIKRTMPLWAPWALATVVLATAYTTYALRLDAITQEVLVSLERILTL